MTTTTTAATAPPYINPPRPTDPAFIIGVTGHMRIEEGTISDVKDVLDAVFEWLRASPDQASDVLGPGLGLSEKTRIIVLSSLAPGADQLVARKAMENGWHVHAPLPFPKDLYMEATTFLPKTDDDEGTIAKIAEAKEFMKAFPEEDTFVVRLEEDADRTDKELKEHLKTILTDKSAQDERHRRYRAAGECLAAYSNILLVLNGSIDRTPDDRYASAHEIQQVKLKGLTPDLILGTSPMGWADIGPALHIRTPKQGEVVKEEAAKAGTISMLFPDGTTYGKGDKEPPALFQLRKEAMLLNDLNKELGGRDPEAEEKALCDMFKWARNTSSSRPIMAHEPIAGTLRRTTWARRRIADQANRLVDERRWYLLRFFRIGFVVALCLAFSENMVPRAGTGPAILQQLLPWAWFLLTLMFIARTMFLFRKMRLARTAARMEDHRGLSEAIRVQTYWTGGGLRKSVANHYMLSQRGELNWLRGAVRSLAFPFWSGQWVFERLGTQAQNELLRNIRNGWLKEQEVYFAKSRDKLYHSKARLEAVGSVGLFTGLFLLVLQVCVQHGPGAWLFASNLCCLWPMWYIMGGLSTLAAWLWWDRPLGTWTRPTLDHELDEARRWRSAACREIVPRSIVGAVLALILAGNAMTLSALTPWLPDGVKLLAILKNVALVVGGFAHLWTAMLFQTENLRRYDAMATLFRAAVERMDELLKENTLPVRKIQDLLFALGKEALNENAEWLGMHRDRPIEPVLPG